MSHPDFKHIGSPAVRLIEECGELIKAICKAERFGYDGFHPDAWLCRSKPKNKWCDRNGPGGFMGHTCGKPKTNLLDILDEIEDVTNAMGEFKFKWRRGRGK